MIYIRDELFDALHKPGGLHLSLQKTIELEHATLPVYLYSYYSLGTDNQEVASIVFSVIFEEMLHFALACNILNAIGGSPAIDDPNFIPKYPGPLPGGVEAELTVNLKRMSKQHVHDTFMVIEEPEHPLNFPVLAAGLAKPLTIGEFYTQILEEIKKAGPGIFKHGKSGRQVTGVFSKSELFKVTDFDSAKRAIDLIKEQGEGTTTSPLDPQKEPAHYYKFAEIYHGKTLQRIPNPPPGTPPDKQFFYGVPPISFDETKVLPVIDDPAQLKYPPTSQAYHLNDNFNYTYTSMLKALNLTFNGQPARLDSAIALMHSMRELAMEMMTVQFSPGVNAGPSFEYQPVNP
jgi:hypothetical protein